MGNKNKKNKTTIPEPPEKREPKIVIPFEVGKIYADVKVTRIAPEEGERCVFFSYAKRSTWEEKIDNKKIVHQDEVMRVPVRDDKGSLVRNAIVWEEIEHAMTPDGFARFVEARSHVVILTE